MSDISLQSPLPDLAPRFVPVVAPAGITRLPLVVILAYLCATFVLFLIWPINWPIYLASGWARLIGYVLLCFTVLGAFAFAGSRGATRVTAQLPYVPHLIVGGAIAAVLMLVPASFAYTGRGPWELLDALSDQGGAYRQLQERLVETTGQRSGIALARALIAPITFAVLPLGILHWRSLNWPQRAAIGVTVACSITFSLLRGTDKEIADLFIVGTTAFLVSFGRSSVLGHEGFAIVKRYWKHLLFAIVFLYLAVGLFTQRKDERLGGYASRVAVCANDSRICANLDNRWISWMPLRQRFGVTFFILSTCSGYYGLNLALEKPFEPTYGAGHSPAALTIYEMVTGDATFAMRTYTYRNRGDGWSDEYYWSTLIVWIANDVGFVGALFVLALLAYMWARWWREATAGMSDPAAVLFALSTMMLFYLPANNQVLASYDGYVMLGAWLAVWFWHRRRYALSAGVPT